MNSFVTRILLVSLNLLSSVIVSVFIIILLIIINPVLALTISGTLGISYLAIFTFVKNFLLKKGKEREAQNRIRFKYLNEVFNGIKDIKILGKERVFLDLFSEATKKHGMSDSISDFINESPRYLLETIAVGSIIGVIVFMISSGSKLEYFLPILTVYTFGAYRLLPSLQKIFKAIASIKYHIPLLQNLHNDYVSLPLGENLPAEDIFRMPFERNIKLSNIVFCISKHGQ
jgi:ABC-type bacteriocin/lantibiotic exporter with double-glycine peptidase domain